MTQAGLELVTQLKMTLSFFILLPPPPERLDFRHVPPHWVYAALLLKPRTACMLDKCSVSQASSPAPVISFERSGNMSNSLVKFSALSGVAYVSATLNTGKQDCRRLG